MFKKIMAIFKLKPIDESLLAKKVDSMPQPAVNDQITDAVTQTPAQTIKEAVQQKNTKPATRRPAKPVPAKTTAVKKKPSK